MLFFKASGATAIRALFTLLNKENKPVILLGPSNIDALEPVALSARLWKLVQVWTSTFFHLCDVFSLFVFLLLLLLLSLQCCLWSGKMSKTINPWMLPSDVPYDT